MTPPDPEKLSLSQRRRSAADSEMQSIPWLCTLERQHQLLARAALHLGDAKSGDDVVRVGIEYGGLRVPSAGYSSVSASGICKGSVR
jgi:hypothetical protein